jgi:putative ABC transport system permease protein
VSARTVAPGERAYRLLLLLYPRRFRQRYAEDLLDFYRERVGAAENRLAIPGIWLQLVPDLVATAARERFAWLDRETEQAPVVARVYSHRREDIVSIIQQDLRYAFRGMLAKPAFSLVILATLALGIGANTAIFTVVNAVMLRPLALGHPDRVVSFRNEEPYGSVSEEEFLDYQRGVTKLAKLAAYSTPSIVIAGGDADPLRTYAARVSRDFFDIAGVKPAIGRGFVPDEFAPQTHARVAILGHRLWVQQFGADRSVIGKTMKVNGGEFIIIGVMPAGFTFPDADASLWIPWRLNVDSLRGRNNHYLNMVGLLADGATVAEAQAQARTLASHWMRDFPETYMPDKPIRPDIMSISDAVLGPTRPYLVALLGAVGFVLLIACVNVASLLLVRSDARRKELAIRTALGASAARLVRQMLTESFVFAGLGGLLGTVIAATGTRALVALAPSELPRIDQVSIDVRVVVFTLAATVLTGLTFGLLPALRATRSDAGGTLREGGKTSASGGGVAARRALVISEIALAVMMLAGAGLLVRSLTKLQEIGLGFSPEHVMTMRVTVPSTYNDTTSNIFLQQVVEKAAALPGVRSAGAINDLPISGNDNNWSILVDGKVVATVAEAGGARPQVVTPDLFRALDIHLVRGRGFTANDRADAPLVGIVSEGMAKQLWPGADPVGHTVRMFQSKDDWVTIVGVVSDVRALGYQRDIPPTLYVPYAQSRRSAYATPTSMTLAVRGAGDPYVLAPPMRGIVRSLDRSAAISQVESMDQVVGNSIASRRFTTALLACFAALALCLAGIGIYGVISYGVAQRRYEIGVRLAMGASASSILRLVLGEGARLTAIGLVLGLLGALAVERSLQTLLVGVGAGDAPTTLAVSLMLALVAALACLIPARRATAVSPTEALRNG